MWNPAIADWRTWRKCGEQVLHGEHGKLKDNGSLDAKHSENIMFTWSKPSNYSKQS